MIINLRGNHASGKSTAVKKVLESFRTAPSYGLLGPKFAEAYRCLTEPPLYILGPYDRAATAGCDYVTKKGVDAMIALLEKYSAQGDVLFESILTSVRFGKPGEWLEAHKEDVVVVILDTPFEEILRSLDVRRERSEFSKGTIVKHVKAQQRQFENVQRTLKGKGFRMIYVDRKTVVPTILKLLRAGV